MPVEGHGLNEQHETAELRGECLLLQPPNYQDLSCMKAEREGARSNITKQDNMPSKPLFLKRGTREVNGFVNHEFLCKANVTEILLALSDGCDIAALLKDFLNNFFRSIFW